MIGCLRESVYLFNLIHGGFEDCELKNGRGLVPEQHKNSQRVERAK